MSSSDLTEAAPSAPTFEEDLVASSGTPAPLVYLGTFLIALSTLALEILVTRLLSVVTWYHLAFFAISTAMLGMTAGAVRVYLVPARFDAVNLAPSVATACRGFAMVVPVTLLVLCAVPLELGGSTASLLILVGVTVACAAPFFFSGIAIAAVLSRSPLPVARVYGADLLGAAMGCLLVLFGLEKMDVPSLVILTAAGGAAAALAYAPRPSSAWPVNATLAGLLILFAFLNSRSPLGIQPIIVKGRFEDPRTYEFQKWNSYSRVVVYKPVLAEPSYWGPSPLAPRTPIRQFAMNIDGLAGTSVRPFRTLADIEHLRFDVTNVGYYLRPSGGAAVIGVGGGRDVQAAVLFGHKHVDGIEVNPIFVSLLEGVFRDFAGVAGHEGVTLHVDEARSHLARSDAHYRILQMSLIDTWAATGAGAFSLSENGLYTLEAWSLFLDRLTDDGIFTVSRWHDPGNLGETGRVISLAVATLLDRGVAEPSRHIALLTRNRIATLLVARSPFSQADVGQLRRVAGELQFDIAALPGTPPAQPVLQGLLNARGREELTLLCRSQPLNYWPPTDDNPFFFNMLPFSRLLRVTAHGDDEGGGTPLIGVEGGVVAGNIAATKTLAALILCLLFLVIATILIPLLARSSGLEVGRVHGAGAAYFSLIGAGFMFAEIGLIQRLSVFLGHPVYALGVVLFTIIGSTGVGSLLSDRISVTRGVLPFAFPVLTAGAFAWLPLAFQSAAGFFQHTPQGSKIAVTVALLFPFGLLLGTFFPVGMRLARVAGYGETPWYWALNGAFGVLSSALAVLVAIYSAISTSFFVAAACYLLALPCMVSLVRDGRKATSRHPT